MSSLLELAKTIEQQSKTHRENIEETQRAELRRLERNIVSIFREQSDEIESSIYKYLTKVVWTLRYALAAVVVVPIVLMLLAVGWEYLKVRDLQSQKAQLSAQNQALIEQNEKAEEQLKRLAMKGGTLIITNCRHKEELHPCVKVNTTTNFGADKKKNTAYYLLAND